MLRKIESRITLAILSACGMAVSAVAYTESFSAPYVDNILSWFVVLIIGMIVLSIPMYLLEYPESRSITFFLKGFMRNMPRWVAPCAQSLLFIAAIHLVLFLLHSGLGDPRIKDGKYILDNRGQIMKEISRSEYLTLKGEKVRMLASMMIAFYFEPMMYWSFHNNPKNDAK